MYQIELFKINFNHDLANKIKYWRNKIRTGEKNIFKREKNKRLIEVKLSLIRLKDKNGLFALSSYREKKKLLRILELQKKVLSITYKLYLDAQIKRDNLYSKLNSNLRSIS